MRHSFARIAVTSILLAGMAGSALAASEKVESQGFGAPAPSSNGKVARRAAYAAAVVLALHKLAEKAHTADDLSFSKGMRVQGAEGDLTLVLPKCSLFGKPLELRVLNSALTQPTA